MKSKQELLEFIAFLRESFYLGDAFVEISQAAAEVEEGDIEKINEIVDTIGDMLYEAFSFVDCCEGEDPEEPEYLEGEDPYGLPEESFEEDLIVVDSLNEEYVAAFWEEENRKRNEDFGKMFSETPRVLRLETAASGCDIAWQCSTPIKSATFEAACAKYRAAYPKMKPDSSMLALLEEDMKAGKEVAKHPQLIHCQKDLMVLLKYYRAGFLKDGLHQFVKRVETLQRSVERMEGEYDEHLGNVIKWELSEIIRERFKIE